MRIHPYLIGRVAEILVAEHLLARGYVILEKNWRIRSGEIDLIALSKGCVVFIEVKARRMSSHFDPFEAVDAHKMKKLRDLGARYLKRKASWLARRRVRKVRYDTVAVLYEFGIPRLLRIKLSHREGSFE